MYIYVVEKGCKYEGGAVSEVFSSYEMALKSKPTSYCYPNVANNEERSIWFYINNMDYFEIRKMKVKDISDIKLKICKRCGFSEEEEKMWEPKCRYCDEKLEYKMEEALE